MIQRAQENISEGSARRATATVGVVIVSYNSSDVIEDCLRSLQASADVVLRVVVCDNCSTDDTRQILQNFLTTSPDNGTPNSHPSHSRMNGSMSIELLVSSKNRGYGSGVNIGLRHLMKDEGIDLFWVLNPDCTVLPNTAACFVERAVTCGTFGLMGGRILYHKPSNIIQTDGGICSKYTGVCSNLNQGLHIDAANEFDVESIDYVPGASIVASRDYIEKVGFLSEDYFLYYEEVEWATRSCEFPIVVSKSAIVIHRGGTSTGSATPNRSASALTNYFNYRNRLRYISKRHSAYVPLVYAYAILKVIKIAGGGDFSGAIAAILGLNQFGPPRGVRERLKLASEQK